jgi:hypothetical protein
MPHEVQRHRDRESTILMIQWAVWKHLGEHLVMDGEKMQRLAEKLAEGFYAEGMRMPMDDDATETPIQLQADIAAALKELPGVPVPQVRQRERAKYVAHSLFNRGWRRYSEVA